MSESFIWDQGSLGINIQEMDAEHRQLVDLMNRLHQLYDAGAPTDAQGKAFAALANFTERHFQHEEGYMRSIGYAGLIVHQGVHRHLLDKLNDHARAFKQTGRFGDDLFVFLHMWLRAHICGIDTKYAAHALARKVANS